MTPKEIAERLNDAIKHAEFLTGASFGELRKLAAEIVPPKPKYASLVWFRVAGEDSWNLGISYTKGVMLVGDDQLHPWHYIEWKPTRVLAPDEVPVKIPPVSEWPLSANRMGWVWLSDNGGIDGPIITRAEAEKMEGE